MHNNLEKQHTELSENTLDSAKKRMTAWCSARMFWGGIIATIIIGLDQWSKTLASTQLEYRRPVEVTHWFNFTLTHNTGAAFSFLAEAGGWQRWLFALVTLGVSGFMLVWLARLQRHQIWLGLALGLILGGGLGNLYDRLTLGYVIDFISVHYHNWYWPAFNVADAAISFGAFLLILDSLRPLNKS